MTLISPLAPIASLELLPTGSTDSKKKKICFECDRQKLRPVTSLVLPLTKGFFGLFTRWRRKINPTALGNVPSGVSDYMFIF